MLWASSAIKHTGSKDQSKIEQRQYLFYKRSVKIKNCLTKDQFDLAFDEIRNSMVDAGFWKVFCTIIRWRIKYTNQGIPNDLQMLETELPVEVPNFSVHKDKITYTWIGHSTAVISFGKDATFLIDPVFSQRCSPYQWIGPKRFRPPACQIEQLPQIDAVLISHDHFDHLDEHSLKGVFKKNQNCMFIAGLNTQDVLPTNCKYKTMDWTEQYELMVDKKAFKITFVPACHWSRRGLFDKNYRLWRGFVIEAPNGKRVFYSGDTAYCGVFKQVGDHFNGFDLSILPIGAYLPREYLKDQHVDPAEAVQVHLDIRSKLSIGVHWGTFPLGFEHYTPARAALQEQLRKREIEKTNFITVNHGGHLEIDY